MTDYPMPAALLATILADAAERDELREANASLGATLADQARQMHDMSQERLRESERAAAAEAEARDRTREVEGYKEALDTVATSHSEAWGRAHTAEDELRKAVAEGLELRNALTIAEDERQRLALDLEGMREARDTLVGELGRQDENADRKDRPLALRDRVRLVVSDGYSHAPHGAQGVVAAGIDDELTVGVRWDAAPGVLSIVARSRLERAL